MIDSNVSLLLPHHIDHLIAEGFTTNQINQLQTLGVRSITQAEAIQKGFKVWAKGDWISGSGIYFPFTDGFGQIRLDTPITREDGSCAKYLTPCKAKAQAYLPENCRVITEGFKDSQAGTLQGEIPTGAIAGVSHYKALPQSAGLTTIFDSDGWTNPHVITSLIYCGVWLKGKINLIPTIPGQPKAGLCEYFKAGYTKEDYQKLIQEAYTPKQFLFEWLERFALIPQKWLSAAIKKAIALALELLDDLEQELVLNTLKKATKFSIQKLRAIWEQFQQKSQEKHQKLKQIESSSIGINPKEARYEQFCKTLNLPFEYCATNQTFDSWVFNQIFASGKGNWKVMGSAFYRYTGVAWQHVDDEKIYKMIAEATEKVFRLKSSKEEGWFAIYPYATKAHIESAFGFCRIHLLLENIPNNRHLRAFLNVTVNMVSGEQMPHNKEDYLTSYIPYNYVPDRPIPTHFHEFLKASYGSDMIPVIRAFTSMFLDPTAPYGKFPHLLGQSGGGKGTLGRLWSSFYGNSAGCGEFSNLATPEGRYQHLTGKAVFAIPDVGGFVQGLRAFYELVDNGAMSARALFSSVAPSIKWNVRFWVASVDHLQIEYAGDGWERRAYPIPLLNKKVQTDPHLGQKLETEIADIISWALAMPSQERDLILLAEPNNERIRSVKLDAALYGDSVKSFVDLCLRPSQSGKLVNHHILHSFYTAYCKAHNYAPMGMSKFVSHLKLILPQNFVPRAWSPTINKQRYRIPAHWQYISVLDGVFVDLANSEKENASNGYQGTTEQQEPQWICCKSKCVEGGLELFGAFWNPPDGDGGGSGGDGGNNPPSIPPNQPSPNQGTGEQPISSQSTASGCNSGGNRQYESNPSKLEGPSYQSLKQVHSQAVQAGSTVQSQSFGIEKKIEKIGCGENSLSDCQDFPLEAKSPGQTDIPLSESQAQQVGQDNLNQLLAFVRDKLMAVRTIADREAVEQEARKLGLPTNWKKLVRPLLDAETLAFLKSLKNTQTQSISTIPVQKQLTSSVIAPNGEALVELLVDKGNGETLVLPLEYPGSRGYGQTKEPREIAKKLVAIQSVNDWEAIKQKYGELRSLWVWRWYFNESDRQKLASVITGKCEQLCFDLDSRAFSDKVSQFPEEAHSNKEFLSSTSVTRDCNHPTSIDWLIRLLEDLEAIPAPHPRFESNEQLSALLQQADLLGKQCSDLLLNVCPDYWERLSIAIGNVCELLP